MAVITFTSRITRRSLRNRSRRRLRELLDQLRYERELLTKRVEEACAADLSKDDLIARILVQLDVNHELRQQALKTEAST